MAIKTDKQVKVDFIVTRLRLGEGRGEVLARFGKKWQDAPRTFDRLLKVAQEQHTEEQGRIKIELEMISTEAQKNALKLAIFTADERKQLLSKIISGERIIKKPMIVNGKVVNVPVEADFSDISRAIAELNKMEGDYKPVTTNVNVNSVGLASLTDEYIEK